MTSPDDNWDDLASWWVDEAAGDPTYRHDVHPMLTELIPSPPGVTADLGCGDGQGMPVVGGTVVGIDLSLALARTATTHGPCVVARLPDLSMFRSATFDAAYSVYLVDLIGDHDGFFASCSRIVRRGGVLVVIMNHPVYTAVGSAPLMDEDGEILWRWGSYFSEGSAVEPAGHREIRYFHRPLGMLLTSAADHGWRLERMVERGLSAASTTALGVYDGQEAIPRLLGVRWVLDGPVGAHR
jgi:SAM-dependent methyltransferase